MILKSIKKILISTVDNFIVFLGCKYTLQQKIAVFFIWIKINLKFIVSRFYKIKKENFLGYKIKFFDYGAFKFIFEEIFIRGEYFIDVQKNNPIIFDCGANIGMATIFFKWIYPESTIFSFEPDPKTFLALKKNIDDNNIKGVKIFNFVLSKIEGDIKFFINDRPGFFSMGISKEDNLLKEIVVKGIKLSSFIEKNQITHIDLLKMDIEGSEGDVVEDLSLSGKIGLFSKVIVEYHHNLSGKENGLGEFLSIFEKNGYNIQLDANFKDLSSGKRFQNILIYLSKKNI